MRWSLLFLLACGASSKPSAVTLPSAPAVLALAPQYFHAGTTDPILDLIAGTSSYTFYDPGVAMAGARDERPQNVSPRLGEPRLLPLEPKPRGTDVLVLHAGGPQNGLTITCEP